MSELDCLLIDFDGTFTHAEQEGETFTRAYRADLSARLARDIDLEWEEAEATIRAHPREFGWLFGGKLVAPGNADPFIRATTIARMLMDRHGAHPQPEDRERILSELYLSSYEHSGTVFRADARSTLETLLGTGIPLHVVSNSDTRVISRKIERLLAGFPSRPVVHGNAQKAVIEDPDEPDRAFAALPEVQHLAGLERPIYLRRGRYYEVLREIWRTTGARPDRTLMIGDIYELDLAMPHHLGVAVHLVAGETTAEYERQYVAKLPRGGVSDTLSAVLHRLGG